MKKIFDKFVQMERCKMFNEQDGTFYDVMLMYRNPGSAMTVPPADEKCLVIMRSGKEAQNITGGKFLVKELNVLFGNINRGPRSYFNKVIENRVAEGFIHTKTYAVIDPFELCKVIGLFEARDHIREQVTKFVSQFPGSELLSMAEKAEEELEEVVVIPKIKKSNSIHRGSW